jgi:hypothetical protein
MAIRKRLFLDVDTVTQWEKGLVQRFPQAEKVPIRGLEPGSTGPWDGETTTIYGSVLVEDGLFRMWYTGQSAAVSHGQMPDRFCSFYAESDDGINWRKPDLGITGQNRYPGNNLLTLPGPCMGVVPALPASGVKYLAAVIKLNLPPEEDITDVPENPPGVSGTCIYGSDDGLHWRFLAHVVTHGDCCCFIVDPARERYVLYNKVGAVHGLISRRSFIGLESRDGIHWEGYEGVRKWRECFVADDYDDLIAQQRGFLEAEYYGLSVYPAGELYVSVETLFTVGSPLVQRFAQNPNGLCHLRLGFSHDGMHWRHPRGRPPWMELGAPGEQDAGFVAHANTFTEHGDDLLLYYGGGHYDHGWCINTDFTLNRDIPLSDHADQYHVMLARIKRDRFGSLAASYRARFDVEPELPGEELFINARCPNGSVRVAIAGPEGVYHGALRKGESLPGFSFDDCIPFTGDSVRAPIRFRDASIRDLPRDRHVVVRFEVTRGEVFGYEWAEAT